MRLCFCYKDSTVPLLSKFQASSYTARFVSNLFGNHIVGFLMRRLTCKWLKAYDTYTCTYRNLKID